MKIANTFDVPLPPHQAWNMLMDVERIVHCVPGAQFTQKLDEDNFTGKIAVRLGPVSLSFDGKARFDSRDASAHRAQMTAQGADGKGRGGANATVLFRIDPAPSGATVHLDTDLTLSGSVAQYGRASGLIQGVATQMVQQFSTALKAMIERENLTVASAASLPSAATTPDVADAPLAAKPIGGVGLMLRVLWNAIRRRLGFS